MKKKDIYVNYESDTLIFIDSHLILRKYYRKRVSSENHEKS
jgi:hypothetical protein